MKTIKYNGNLIKYDTFKCNLLGIGIFETFLFLGNDIVASLLLSENQIKKLTTNKK